MRPLIFLKFTINQTQKWPVLSGWAILILLRSVSISLTDSNHALKLYETT